MVISVSLPLWVLVQACKMACPSTVEVLFAKCWAFSPGVSVATTGTFDIKNSSVLMMDG